MPASSATVLIVDRPSRATEALITSLRGHGMKVLWSRDGDAAARVLDGTRVDALIAPVGAPRIDGLALYRHARQRHPGACVVLLADARTAPVAEEALGEGVHDVLTRPVSHARLLASLARGLAHQRLVARLAELERRLDEQLSLAPFTGRSRAIARVMEQVRHVASTHAAVLIEGEVGTGKGLAAQVIHQGGPRRGGPFVRLDCGALREPLLERELLGFEPEQPSQGEAAQPGRLERADGGTLFLDEIHELTPPVQVRLLRVLQDHAFERVGGRETLKVDVRLIAATSRDLGAQVREGRFREDLFLRLSVARIGMPPLRERREDIPALVDRILAESSRARGRGVRSVTRGVLDRLMAHPWPGNVRELRDTIEAMVIVARRGRALEVADLGQSLIASGNDAGGLEIVVGTTVEDAERQLISATLAHARGDKPRAASLLGIGLRTLYRKIKAYRIR